MCGKEERGEKNQGREKNVEKGRIKQIEIRTDWQKEIRKAKTMTK
jgi:hypothetical protein